MAEFKSDTVELNRNELQCTVCHELTNETMCPQACMHITCNDCFHKMFHAGHNGLFAPLCPVCRSSSPWIKNVMVNRIVGGMRVQCQYKCDADVAYSDYARHIAECPYRPATCPHGCGWKGTWAEFLTHADECDEAIVMCQHCGASVHRGAHAGHVEMCNYRKTKCEHCNVDVMLWKLKRHKCSLDECKESETVETVPPTVIIQARMIPEWRHLQEQLVSPFCTEEEQNGCQILRSTLLDEARNLVAEEAGES